MCATSAARHGPTYAHKFDNDHANFKEHIEKTHNLFNYLFFIQHLYEMPPNECSVLELEIKQKLYNKDISWIPYLVTKDLSKSALSNSQAESS